jgi:hypothetical protein
MHSAGATAARARDAVLQIARYRPRHSLTPQKITHASTKITHVPFSRVEKVYFL